MCCDTTDSDPDLSTEIVHLQRLEGLYMEGCPVNTRSALGLRPVLPSTQGALSSGNEKAIRSEEEKFRESIYLYLHNTPTERNVNIASRARTRAHTQGSSCDTGLVGAFANAWLINSMAEVAYVFRERIHK